MGAIKSLPADNNQQGLEVGEIVVKKCLCCKNFVSELFHFDLNGEHFAVCGMDCGMKKVSAVLSKIILKQPKKDKETFSAHRIK